MSVSFRVTGTWAELTADGAVAIPATPQAGDRMYLFARWKDFSITATVADWTELTEFADGSTGSGNGTGSVKVGCWYRDWQSGDTNPTLDFSASPTNASVVIMVMQKGVDDVWTTPVARTAAMTNWTTSSQIVSASATADVPAGGVVMGLVGIRDDTATMTRPTTGIDVSSGITWNGDYVESPSTHHSTTTGDDGAADLGYRLVTLGGTVALRMTGTISAAETGAALWVIQGTTIVVTPSPAAFTVSGFAPTLKHSVTPPTQTFSLTSFAPALKESVTPQPASFTLTTFAPSLKTGVTPSPAAFVVTTFALVLLPPSPAGILFLDPGGDAVQAVEYFALAQGTNAPTFDTSQKVVGVGSYKFDSTGDNDNSYNKVAGVLGQSGRISAYFRYDSVLDTSNTHVAFPSTDTEHSGGGFTDTFLLSADDSTEATASPGKNSGQGSALSDFGIELDPTWVVDSIKIIYQRHYSTASSIGISCVRWVVGAEEGPNHDNTDMPTSALPEDSTVEVDISAERTWTPADLNSIQVIAEALRGDTDTSHIQSWDYVSVQVEYRLSVGILFGQTIHPLLALRLEVLPTGSGVVLRYIDADGVSCFDGITVIPPDTDPRIAVCYRENGLNDLDLKVYIDSVEELSLTGRSTAPGGLLWPDLAYGWIGNPGANRVCWLDQLYIDDGFDLSDPGPIHMTAKLGASTNADNFDTTGGTGAVNERPVSLTNYKQHAGSDQVDQNYTLQTAAVGDIDISGKTLLGHMGWAVAEQETGTGTSALMLDGVTTALALTTSPSFVKVPVTSAAYPDDAAGIGLRSSGGTADTFLYEGGVVVAYEAPVETPLFPRYLLLEDSETEVFDDLRASPPTTYDLRYWVEGPDTGSVLIKAYSIGSENEAPQLQSTAQSTGGSGITRVTPGIEVKIVITVTGADMYVALARYLNL